MSPSVLEAIITEATKRKAEVLKQLESIGENEDKAWLETRLAMIEDTLKIGKKEVARRLRDAAKLRREEDD